MTVRQYNEAVEAYADRIFRFVVKNLRNEDQAQDVVQETFAKLWVKRDNVNFEKVRSYLFTAAYHTMIDHIRKEKRQGDWEEVNPVSHSTSRQYSDLQELLHQALDRLPDIQRTVILLRDYEGYKYDEIGEITSLSESQVKVYIFRARKTLKKYIGSMDAVL